MTTSPPKPICVFRVDASSHIGLGHMMRCFNLADILSNNGFDIHFISRDLDFPIAALFSERSFTLHMLPHPTLEIDFDPDNYVTWLSVLFEKDADDTIRYLKTLPSTPEWLVVDHYAIDSKWEKLLQKHVNHLFVIDDLANRDHHCDILLDQHYTEEGAERYKKHVSKECKLLLGPKYILLSEKFRKLQASASPRSHVSKILISFGGADFYNETLKALTGALKVAENREIYVVVGIACPHKDEIQALCEQYSQCYFYYQPSNLDYLVNQADLAIGAGGMSLWERIALGLPSIVACIAENQREILEDIDKAGYIHYLGLLNQTSIDTYADAIQYYQDSPRALADMSLRCRAWIDGLGCQRVLNAMLSNITLRLANMDDMERTFEWRNHENVRRWSLSSEIIDRKTHEQWFINTLNNAQRQLLIAMNGKEPIGVVRFDEEKENAEISIYLSPYHIGKGLGEAIVRESQQWIKKYNPRLKKITARVLLDNIASQKIFIRAGFIEHHRFSEHNQEKGIWYYYDLHEKNNGSR